MSRTLFTAASALLLCCAVGAQSLDSSRIHPITTPIRDAGTLDLGNGIWWGSSNKGRASTKVYDNTCVWTGGAFYYGPEHCEDTYDEGRIPSPTDPSAPAGATWDNWIDSFQIGYCTVFPTGKVDIKIACWNHKGGACVGGSPQNAIFPPDYNGATAYFDFVDANLPGDGPSGGPLACWIVTIDLANTPGGGFCLRSDGDGSWSGSEEDLFTWAFQHEMDNSHYGLANGPIIAADPGLAPFGGCSYDIPCGTDATSSACGTGLGTADSYWTNVDGCPIAGTGCTGVPPGDCGNAAASGTGCYSFGGWPANRWASFWLEMSSVGSCRDHCRYPPEVYCSYEEPNPASRCGFSQCPSSSGCTARITTTWILHCPEQDGDDYDLIVEGTESQKWGIVFGTTAGRTSVAPFSSGTLCCQAPITRTPPQTTGTQGGPCTGTLSLRLNDPSSSSPILNQPPGTMVNYQGWTRDPAGPVGTDLSDAIEIGFR